MASVTIRTPAKVNSSAMIARQPDVPKRIAMVVFKNLLKSESGFHHNIGRLSRAATTK
jgi:hypothetical protein